MASMTKELFQILENTAEGYGIKVHTDYSGKCMYGKECIGLSGPMEDIQQVLQSVTIELHELDDEPELFYEWMNLCFNYSMDSMGMDKIIYWSMIRSVEE